MQSEYLKILVIIVNIQEKGKGRGKKNTRRGRGNVRAVLGDVWLGCLLEEMGKLIRDPDRCVEHMSFINSQAGARLIFKDVSQR